MRGLIWCDLPDRRGTVVMGLVVDVDSQGVATVVDGPAYARARGWVGLDARGVWRMLLRQGARLQWVPDEPGSAVYAAGRPELSIHGD